MTLYKWSQTASADATADPTINWMEGQAPSSINDSARAMMAAVAKYRDDVTGAIVTAGTNTAYTVSTYEVFQSLSQLNGQIVAFTPHATNGAGPVTLNIDGLGTKALRSAPNVELPAGVLIQGTPYVALYNNTDGAFYLRGIFGNPYNIPIGAAIDYFSAALPNSSFALAYGQAISRAAYATLFSLFGINFGAGDGSTTFNLPDLRGRVVAGKDDMGGAAASRLTTPYFGGSPVVLGSVSATTDHITLGTANLPPYTPSGSLSGTAASGSSVMQNGGPVISIQGAGGASVLGFGLNTTPSFGSLVSSLSGALVGNPQGGTSAPISSVQPTIVANKILRII